MTPREREELEEIAAMLADAESESVEIYGGFHMKASAARMRIQKLLEGDLS